MLRRFSRVIVVVFALSSTVGCDSDLDVRIGAALRGTADSVTLTDTQVLAACKGGGEASVPIEQLALDVFGMADIEKQTAVAQSLNEQCDALIRKRAQSAQVESAVDKAAKELGIAKDGKEQDALKAEVCAALAKQLPRKGELRDAKIAENTRSFGCADPGEPELGPAKLWQVSEKGEGKSKAVYLRLDSEAADGEDADQLTIKCAGKKKLEVYLATKSRLGKAPLIVQIDNKRARWTTRLSKSKKAVFLKDAKKGVKSLLGKDQLVVTLPAKGKPTRTFPIDGIEAALEPHAKACGI